MTAVDELPPEETMEMLGGPLDGILQPLAWENDGPAEVIALFTAKRPPEGTDFDPKEAAFNVAEYQLAGLHTVSRRWIYVPRR
ncbi:MULTISPECIES: hypothetical protein [Bacteria]|uniref:hypothetical protein n=1 Tax=Bacteria TaxID=2 RepID=UPI0006211521|nr:hypothetical protein [Leucobacter sp. Ag1]KKI20569.1 hypothetical protein XM48_07590 [Leucobacter sp. Ag1]